MKKTLVLLTFFFVSVSTFANDDFVTEQDVNLSKYLGTWYEIARYKNNFQKKCLGTKATYKTFGPYIKVVNECQISSRKIKKARALALVTNKKTNATLKVSFVPFLNLFGLFAGDYNILKLGPNYEYALVGDKARTTFWILSRSKTMNDALYFELLDIAEDRGFKKELIFKSPVWKN